MTQEPGPDHTPPRGRGLICSVPCVSCRVCARAPWRGPRFARALYVACTVCCLCHVSRQWGPGAPLAALMARRRVEWYLYQTNKKVPRPSSRTVQHITTRCAVPHTWKMRATHRHGQRQRATARREGPRAKQEGSTPLRVGHRRAQPECEPHGTVTHKGTTKLRPRHLLLDIAAHGQRAEDVGDGGGRE